MTALAANTNAKSQARAASKTYVVKTGEIIYWNALVGIDSNGDLVAWADTAGHKFVGVANAGPVTGDDAATPAVRAEVDDRGPTLYGVDVANVTDRNSIGALVYCADDNYATLSTTASTNVKAIGRIIDWRSNADMDVRTFTPTEYLNQPLIADVTALTDSSGGAAADGTIGAVTAPTALSADGSQDLTDNTGGTASGAGAIANLADGTTYANDHAAIENNLSTLVAEYNLLRAEVSAIRTATASERTAIVALTDAVKELATKVNEIIADLNIN